MTSVRIELVTGDPCPGPECEKCREANQIVQEVTASGLARVLRHFGLQLGSAYKVHHVTAEDARNLGLDPDDLPVLRLNGQIILVGPGWTEDEVRKAVDQALRLQAPPA